MATEATHAQVVKALHTVDCGCDKFVPEEDAYYDDLAAYVVRALETMDEEINGVRP